jgi:cytochrome P450
VIKVAIIIGSTRPGRNGEAVVHWVRQIARQRQEGTLDHAGLVSLAFLLLTAGHETTANMIR